MKQSTTTYVAMDTHKKTISVALAEGRRRGETRFLGEVPSRPEAVAKMVDRLSKKHGQLAFCYEAGLAGTGSTDKSQCSAMDASWSRPR
jgi:hypothetical protein